MGFKGAIPLALGEGIFCICAKVQEQMLNYWNVVLWNTKLLVIYIPFVQNKNILINFKDLSSKTRSIFVCQWSWLTHGHWRYTDTMSINNHWKCVLYILTVPILAIQFGIYISGTFLDSRLGEDFEEVLLRD